MKPSILFHVAVSLCCQLKVPLIDDTAGIVIQQNLVFSICGLHAFLEKNENMDISNFWSSLDLAEQDRFRKTFGILDPRKGKRTLQSFISDTSGQHDNGQHPFISYLLQRMGKITFQMGADQVCFLDHIQTTIDLYFFEQTISLFDALCYFKICE